MEAGNNEPHDIGMAMRNQYMYMYTVQVCNLWVCTGSHIACCGCHMTFTASHKPVAQNGGTWWSEGNIEWKDIGGVRGTQNGRTLVG